MLLHPRTRMSESDIAFYFGEGATLLGGQSNLGPMLEHASMYWVPPEQRVPDSEVTRWTMRQPRSEPAFHPDHGRLRRFGRISRRLQDAGRRMPEAPAILAAYYGEVGDRFARLPKIGRLGAIIRFTEAGQRLLASYQRRDTAARAKAALKLTADQRAENVMATASSVPDKSLIAVAQGQALTLLRQALQAYMGEEIYEWAAKTAAAE